ncbi:LIC_13387 family protein [Roseateles toxinivorans]|uniref:Uncharacterized protein n=1 Tax=Roseateles toxinivorans TaxID=270368 RepID=A0A4R6QSV6_9BURK|nr:hypothetical protein [Roseateles toxinivorans]TDP74286.1 hypothetical protein DES47_101343 [Roseateles toxinivorans]
MHDPSIAALLLAASAAVLLLLGSAHLLLTFAGDRFHPRDPALTARLQEESPRISRQTTMWRAGLGFHASHSLGAMLFGLIYLYLALEPERFVMRSTPLLWLGFAYLLAMVLLARRYWFNVPFRGVALAAALYAAALLLR